MATAKQQRGRARLTLCLLVASALACTRPQTPPSLSGNTAPVEPEPRPVAAVGGWTYAQLDPARVPYLGVEPSRCLQLPDRSARFANGQWLLATRGGTILFWSGGALLSQYDSRSAASVPAAPEIGAAVECDRVGRTSGIGGRARCVLRLQQGDGGVWSTLRMLPSDADGSGSVRSAIFAVQQGPLDADAGVAITQPFDLFASTDTPTFVVTVRAEGRLALALQTHPRSGPFDGALLGAQPGLQAPGAGLLLANQHLVAAYASTTPTASFSAWVRDGNEARASWWRLRWRYDESRWNFAGRERLEPIPGESDAATPPFVMGGDARCLYLAERTEDSRPRDETCPAGVACSDRDDSLGGRAWCRELNAGADADAGDTSVLGSRVVVRIGCLAE